MDLNWYDCRQEMNVHSIFRGCWNSFSHLSYYKNYFDFFMSQVACRFLFSSSFSKVVFLSQVGQSLAWHQFPCFELLIYPWNETCASSDRLLNSLLCTIISQAIFCCCNKFLPLAYRDFESDKTWPKTFKEKSSILDI